MPIVRSDARLVPWFQAGDIAIGRFDQDVLRRDQLNTLLHGNSKQLFALSVWVECEAPTGPVV